MAGPPREGTHESESSLQDLLSSREIVVVCGSGGVGKTSTAAAMAAMAAIHEGGKVLVLTVDPAKRLAGALGLGGLGNQEKRVPTEALAASGTQPRGELWAAMLDTKQSWDDLVRRHAPDRKTERAILENPLYQNISGKFVQSHDYIAMERLFELHSSGDYDLIVVDTPPTRNALDFIEAPDRMAEFFRSRLLRLLIVPYRSRAINLATRPFYQIADRILGSQFLGDIAEFFILFQTMYEGFVERATEVKRLLRERRTTFVVVSTLEAEPVREAETFLEILSVKKLHLGALVLNKALPPFLFDTSADRAARRLEQRVDQIAPDLAALTGDDAAQVRRVLEEIAGNFHNLALVARREAEQREELASRTCLVATAPELEADIHDLDGLFQLGEHIWRSKQR